jgi:hypothetical protein
MYSELELAILNVLASGEILSAENIARATQEQPTGRIRAIRGNLVERGVLESGRWGYRLKTEADDPTAARVGPSAPAADLAEVLALVAQLAEAGGELAFAFTAADGRRVEIRIGAAGETP